VFLHTTFLNMNNFDLNPRLALQDSSPGPQFVDRNTVNSFNRNQQLQGMSPSPMAFSGFLPSDAQLSFGLGNDLNRLQQLQQQLGVGQPGMQGNQQSQQQPQQQNNNDLFRSLMGQKLQIPTYEDQLRQRLLTAPAEPLLQPQLLGDAPFFMSSSNTFSLSGMNRHPFTLPSPHELSLKDDTRRMRGGVIEPFPEKLHRLLTEVEAAGRSDIISFIAGGKAFAIHKPDKFFKEVVPKYFRQSRLSSFKRQLNLYGFELINTGPARGGYYHEMFMKDRPELCRRMRRVAVKQEDKVKGEGVYNPPPVVKEKQVEADEGMIQKAQNELANAAA
jgi:hypothetical protein